MAQNFIVCDREHELLLPPSLREWLPDAHFAWFVLDAVAEIDLAAFYPGASAPIAACWRSSPQTGGSSSGVRTSSQTSPAGLRPGRLLAVVGASGSGKSSVLRAGVVAVVRADEVDGTDRATIITPGADPQLDVQDDPRRLVVVDQFEELYTLCDDRERRVRFIDALRIASGTR